MATKPSGLTLGGILLQQASTTREAERYKIHPAKPGPFHTASSRTSPAGARSPSGRCASCALRLSSPSSPSSSPPRQQMRSKFESTQYKKYHSQLGVGTAGPEFLLRSKALIFFEILFAFSYVMQTRIQRRLTRSLLV